MTNKKRSTRVDVIFDFKHEARKNPDGMGTVWIRLYADRETRKYISTGVKVRPENFCKSTWVHGVSNATQLNNMIRKAYQECINIAQKADYEGQSVTTKSIKQQVKEPSFLQWMEKQISEEELAAITIERHYIILDKLIQYGKIKMWKDVTEENLKGFLRWLPDMGGKGKRGRIQNTSVKLYWQGLLKFLHLAQKKGLIPQTAYQDIKIICSKPIQRQHLTDEEMEKWINTKLERTADEEARKLFIIQMGTGLSYSDLSKIDFTKAQKTGSMWTLTDTRKKTGEHFFVVILPFAVEVLKWMNWHIPKKHLQTYNMLLTNVCRKLEINKHITSHAGRHTYACYCLRHGIRMEAIQKTLGHARLETTQIYAKLVDMDVVKAFEQIK